MRDGPNAPGKPTPQESPTSSPTWRFLDEGPGAISEEPTGSADLIYLYPEAEYRYADALPRRGLKILLLL
jgi:hypothetical protein